jgi:hypothetical protein
VFCPEDVKFGIAPVYQSLLPYLFPEKYYNDTVIQREHAVLKPGVKADVLMCLGYFYSQSHTIKKKAIGGKKV